MEIRDCGTVISQMIDKIPETEKGLIEALKCNMEDASFKAPEETIQWFRTSETLQKYVERPSKDWEFEILSIFSTIPVEVIKTEVAKWAE